MKRKDKIKHSFASYRHKDGSNVTDIKELAKYLAEGWGNVPIKLNDTRAKELHLLAVEYLRAIKTTAIK